VSEVCAVVVTYFPESAALFKNVTSTLKQVVKIIIVDNTPADSFPEHLAELDRVDAIKVIANGKNLGIAEALNIGFREAGALGFEWVITLDQDSQLTQGLVGALYDTADTLAGELKIGVICPYYRDEKTGALSVFEEYAVAVPIAKKLGSNRAAIVHTITSGSLVSVSVVQKVGGFRKEYFIDLVDVEFCLRLLVQGYLIVAVQGAELNHNLGDMEKRRFFWKDVFITNHSALRRYYYFRNRIFVWKTYIGAFPRWVVKDMYTCMAEAIKILIYEKDKMKKFRCGLKGVCHGITGIAGEYACSNKVCYCTNKSEVIDHS
jgi:rhamnosyltransferase